MHHLHHPDCSALTRGWRRANVMPSPRLPKQHPPGSTRPPKALSQRKRTSEKNARNAYRQKHNERKWLKSSLQRGLWTGRCTDGRTDIQDCQARARRSKLRQADTGDSPRKARDVSLAFSGEDSIISDHGGSNATFFFGETVIMQCSSTPCRLS